MQPLVHNNMSLMSFGWLGVWKPEAEVPVVAYTPTLHLHLFWHLQRIRCAG